MSHCEGREDLRYSLSNKLGDDVMNQGGVGGIRQINLLQERRSMSEMSVEVGHEECKSMLGSMDNRLVVLRCLDSLLDDVCSWRRGGETSLSAHQGDQGYWSE